MAVVRIIIKILLLPVRICLTIIQLVVMFITWLSATVFHILSGIICITAVLGVWIRTGNRHRGIQNACNRLYTVCFAYPRRLDCGVAGSNQN